MFVSEIGIREADVIQSAAFLIPRGDLVLDGQGLVEVVERLLWLAELAVDIADIHQDEGFAVPIADLAAEEQRLVIVIQRLLRVA